MNNNKTGYNFRINQKYFLFAFFLFISTVFWFLIALNDEYITEISYPVKYKNIPSNKVVVKDLPNYLSIKVKAIGFLVLQHKIKSIRPITIDVSSIDLQKSANDTSHSFLLTKYINEEISNQLDANLQLIEIRPDTIDFYFYNSIQKKIAVIPNLELSFQSQYMLSKKLEAFPDSIIVTGPKNIVEKLTEITTEKVEFSNLNSTITTEVKIKKIKKIRFSHEKVKVKIDVEKFTEGQLKIPVEVENIPDSLVLIMFPNEIKVNYLVALSKYETIHYKLFRAVVDYNQIIENPTLNTLKVYIIEQPQEIELLGYSPKRIEFIIEK